MDDHPAVVGTQAGPVGVEDADDGHVGAPRAVVGHGQRLAEPLGLVVDASGADRVDVAPVRLGLGMHLRVTVDLAGGRHQEAGAVALGQLQAVPGALASHGQGLERKGQVVGRRGRTGQVEHAGHRAVDRDPLGDVRLDQREAADGRPGGRHWPAARWRSRRRQTTSSPRASSWSHRWEPRNPEPPSTTTRPLIVGRSPRRRSRAGGPGPGRAGCGRRPAPVQPARPAPWRSRASGTRPTR